VSTRRAPLEHRYHPVGKSSWESRRGLERCHPVGDSSKSSPSSSDPLAVPRNGVSRDLSNSGGGSGTRIGVHPSGTPSSGGLLMTHRAAEPDAGWTGCSAGSAHLPKPSIRLPPDPATKSASLSQPIAPVSELSWAPSGVLRPSIEAAEISRKSGIGSPFHPRRLIPTLAR
jgi:hypothetical protein